LKSDLATLVIESLAPIAERYRELRSDPVALEAVVLRGDEKAAEIAGPVYRLASGAMGLV
jgi:tryptophanyl-tRNA synthetase